MSQIGPVPASPQNIAVKQNGGMPSAMVGKIATLVTNISPGTGTAKTVGGAEVSQELTRFQKFKQKVRAIRSSIVSKVAAHPRIAAGVVGCIAVLAVLGVRRHMSHLGDVRLGEKVPVNNGQPAVHDSEGSSKGGPSGSAPDTDGTNATAVVPNSSITENVGKQKTGNEPVVISLMQKWMPTKVNLNVAGKIGLVGAAVVVAGKVFDAFKFGDIDPSGLDAVVAGGFSYLASLTDLSSADPAILGGAGYRISNLGVTKNQDGSFSNTYASVRDQSPPSERKEDR